MKRAKPILIAAIAGAVVGAFATRGDLRAAAIPAFALDPETLRHRAVLIACFACWPIFSLYWEISARSAPPAKSSESRASRRVHVLLTNLAALLVLIPIRGLGRLLPANVLLMSAGVAVEAAGVALAIWARRHLGRNWSGEITVKVDHELVRSGPYRVLRHPIYTGILMMYVGAALVTGGWLAMIGLATVSFAYWRKIRLEEVTLDGAFGAQYAEYRRTTAALLPRIRPLH
jgi:protein-S-isoprenylcysteine O-methyltransferase Ste14